MFKNLRIHRTALFLTLTISLLLIAGAAAASQGAEPLQQEQAVESQERLARQTATSLAAFFDERQNELRVLTEVYGLGYLDEATQRDVLLTLLSDQPAYYEMAVVDPSGQETLRITRGEKITQDLANRAQDPVFQAAMDTRAISFSPIYFNEKARDRLITITIPVEDIFSGEIGYVLLAEVRFPMVADTVLRELNLTQDDEVYLLDSNGTVVAHRNLKLVIDEVVFNLPEAPGRHTGLSGDDVILAMEPVQLGDQTLTVVAEKLYLSAITLDS